MKPGPGEEMLAKIISRHFRQECEFETSLCRSLAIQRCDVFDVLPVQGIFRPLHSFLSAEAGHCFGPTMRVEAWHILVVFRTKSAIGGWKIQNSVYVFAV